MKVYQVCKGNDSGQELLNRFVEAKEEFGLILEKDLPTEPSREAKEALLWSL